MDYQRLKISQLLFEEYCRNFDRCPVRAQNDWVSCGISVYTSKGLGSLHAG